MNLYSTYKGNEYLGDFTAQQLKEMIGINPVTLYSYESNGYAFRGNYIFVKKSKGKEMTTDQLYVEWDKVRKWLNPNAV